MTEDTAPGTAVTLPLDMTGRRWTLCHHVGEVFDDDIDYDGIVLQIEIRSGEEASDVFVALTTGAAP